MDDGFMKGVDERRLRVDLICMHCYGGSGADSLVKRHEKKSMRR